MAASDYVPIFFKNRLHLAGRPQMGTRPRLVSDIGAAPGKHGVGAAPSPSERRPCCYGAHIAVGAHQNPRRLTAGGL